MIPPESTVWIIIAAIGLGSWVLRYSFMGLLGGRVLPAWVLRHLRYTAVAIIPGLIAPIVLFPPATGGVPDAPRLIAGCVVLAVGIATGKIFPALVAGVAALAVGLSI